MFPRPSRGRLSLALLGGLLCCGLACGSEDPGRPAQRRVAVIPKGTTHEFWKAIHAGARAAGSELGVEVIWKGPLREDDRDAQIRVVEDFVTRGVDGIVLAPLDEVALVAPVKEAAQAGIPVIIIDSDLAWDGRLSYIATDNYRGGALAAEQLGRLLGGEGKVVMMRYLEGSASTTQREAGFLDAIGRKFPGVTVLSSNQYAGATVDGAYRTAENLLISFAEADGIFCPNESAAFGMLRALQDAGRAGKPRFVGFDASEKLIEGLRAGEIDGLVIQDPYAMGRLGVEVMAAHWRGEAVETWIDTGAVFATRENMDDPKIRALLHPDLSGLRE